MVKIVRQQMICIIAPDWRGGVQLSKSDYYALHRLFLDVGVVHFASIALLPPMAGAQLPSLMLELVVEEGLRPYDLLSRLVNHPRGALRSLYRGYLSSHASQKASELNRQLLERLMSWQHIADGGFVGARDRSVQQIKEEKKLLEQARIEARVLKATHGKDRASFALALARWAFGDSRFEWAAEAAPRSYWREKGASIIAKVVAAVIVLWLALLWLIGFLARSAACFDTWLWNRSNPAVQAVFGAVSDASGWLLGVSCRFVLALIVVSFALWVFFVALPALFAFFRRWLDSLVRELDRPTETWSSLSTYLAVWLVGLPLVLAGLWSVVTYTFWPQYFKDVVAQWIPAGPGWKQLLIGGLAILVLIGIGAIFYRFNSLLQKFSAWFYHPHEDDIERAQQVHPSIEESEARLVRGTAHMISLTDMRSPHGWSAWWTCRSLRIVTFLGRVLFTESRLGNAPGIHFGHWHIIDNGRRLLFCSNYDGDFGGYLDDFINGASIGTTLFWRWTKLKPRAPAAPDQPGVAKPRAFPPTRFLVFRGVKCELKFKTYARDSMLPHLYRFDACRLTIDEINRATVLRNALFGERNNGNDDLIMRVIES